MLETFHEEPGTLRRLLSWRACRVRVRTDPLAHQRCAPLRCSWDQTMQKLLAAALVVSWFWGGEARAQTGPLYCYGQYALCPASTCMPTGYEITTRVVSTSGVFIGYRRYPEAVCTCPVLQGKFQASGANLGQMEGSCAQPGWGLVWSLYSPMPLPQAFNYSLKEEHQKPLVQVCPASPQRSFTNCFGFKCSVNAERVNGVPLATCHCPIDDDMYGNPVPRGSSAFKNEAGQCDPNYCSLLPVSVPYSPSNSAGTCLGTPPPLPPG